MVGFGAGVLGDVRVGVGGGDGVGGCAGSAHLTDTGDGVGGMAGSAHSVDVDVDLTHLIDVGVGVGDIWEDERRKAAGGKHRYSPLRL